MRHEPRLQRLLVTKVEVVMVSDFVRASESMRGVRTGFKSRSLDECWLPLCDLSHAPYECWPSKSMV